MTNLDPIPQYATAQVIVNANKETGSVVLNVMNAKLVFMDTRTERKKKYFVGGKNWALEVSHKTKKTNKIKLINFTYLYVEILKYLKGMISIVSVSVPFFLRMNLSISSLHALVLAFLVIFVTRFVSKFHF